MSVEEIKFSKLLPVDKITVATSSYNITASADDCISITERLEVLSVQKFEARLKVKKVPELKAILIEGRVKAKVEQACTLSGQPISEKINETFQSYFVASAENLEKLEQNDPAFLDEDVEVIEGDNIDVAELVTQYLSLFLNPYPRKTDLDISSLNKKGLTLKTEEEMEEDMRKAKNPFQQLKSLKTD